MDTPAQDDCCFRRQYFCLIILPTCLPNFNKKQDPGHVLMCNAHHVNVSLHILTLWCFRIFKALRIQVRVGYALYKSRC